MTDTPVTDRLFIAPASVVASIESGSIAEAEVETITVRKQARPLLPTVDG